MIECSSVVETDKWQDPDTGKGKVYIAGFRAALAENLYSKKIAASGTVQTYTNQVIWILKQHQAHNETQQDSTARQH